MISLHSTFAGIESPNPFWLASGPPSNTAYQVMKAFDKGWGGAVWKTMGVPTVNVYSRYGAVHQPRARLVGMNNIELISDRRLSDNLRDIAQVKARFPRHAVLASIMVQTREEWHAIVRRCEDVGVDGFELNFGCPHGMCERGMGSAVGQEPAMVAMLTEWVMEVATRPVLVKLTPNITDVTESARAARCGGADGIALINTIQSIAGVDIDRFIPMPSVGRRGTNGGLSGPAIKPIALNMVRNCAQDPDVGLPVSGIGGITTWRDAVEFLLLGAGTVQICTAVMHHGFGIISYLLAGLEHYMHDKGFTSIDQLIGRALPNTTTWENLDMNHRVVARIDAARCTGCHACHTACDDGAYQAIRIDAGMARCVPVVLRDRCVGCNLCSLVCPVDGCITMEHVHPGLPEETWMTRTRDGRVPTGFDDPRAGGLAHELPWADGALG